MPIFEQPADVNRESRALNLFLLDMASKYEAFREYKEVKLGKFDLDYIVEFGNGKRITVEVKGCKRKLNSSSFAPFVSIQKLARMQETVNNGGFDASYIIFAYEDGIKYQRLKLLSGLFNWFERKNKRRGAANDAEIVLYFEGTEFITITYKMNENEQPKEQETNPPRGNRKL